MTSCGLPDNCCFCFSLKKGGKIIAGICLATSVISCILLVYYLCSDIDEITKEIADNSDEVEHKLNNNNASALVSAVVLLLLSTALLVSSGLLIKGIQSKSKKKIVPFLAVLGVSIASTLIIAIIQFEKGSFYAAATFVVILTYFFICIYALYKSYDDPAFAQHDTESN